MSEDKIVTKNRGLGRGLDALFGDEEPVTEAPAPTEIEAPAPADLVAEGVSVSDAAVVAAGGLAQMGVDQLQPGTMQPRVDFAAAPLEELAASLRQHGVLQPLVVRPIKGGSRYEIIAGERRWRAAQLAGLHEVPVVIKDLDDSEAMQAALIENLQREDLNPIEEALGYQRMIEEHQISKEALAGLVSRSRSHISNIMRLLNLPTEVLDMVRKGDLSAGHARTLLSADNNVTGLARQVISDGLSVRQVEALVAKQRREAAGVDMMEALDAPANNVPDHTAPADAEHALHAAEGSYEAQAVESSADLAHTLSDSAWLAGEGSASFAWKAGFY